MWEVAEHMCGWVCALLFSQALLCSCALLFSCALLCSYALLCSCSLQCSRLLACALVCALVGRCVCWCVRCNAHASLSIFSGRHTSLLSSSYNCCNISHPLAYYLDHSHRIYNRGKIKACFENIFSRLVLRRVKNCRSTVINKHKVMLIYMLRISLSHIPPPPQIIKAQLRYNF